MNSSGTEHSDKACHHLLHPVPKHFPSVKADPSPTSSRPPLSPPPSPQPTNELSVSVGLPTLDIHTNGITRLVSCCDWLWSSRPAQAWRATAPRSFHGRVTFRRGHTPAHHSSAGGHLAPASRAAVTRGGRCLLGQVSVSRPLRARIHGGEECSVMGQCQAILLFFVLVPYSHLRAM